MFRFEHPGFFWLIGLTILAVIFYFTRQYLARTAWSRWGSDTSNQKITSGQHVRPKWMWLGLLGTVLLTIAAANPQWGYRSVAVESKTADIYLVLDISTSMLAEDIAPSRLERARRIALDLSTKFKTDRVGLVLFAGNAYVQSPLTTDWHAIQLFLNAANPDQAGTQGTSIGEALRLILAAKSSETDSRGAIIVLTDGEDHDTDAPDAIEEAAEAGWVTYIIGVGTEAGATIPITNEGQKYLKLDDKARPVHTSLNKTLMMELAQKGKGKYFDATGGDKVVEELGKELAGLERSKMEKRSFTEHRSYFQWFLFPALLLIGFMVVANYKSDVI